MQESESLSSRQKQIEKLRWLLFAPAAILGSLATEFLIEVAEHLLGLDELASSNSSEVVIWLMTVPIYALPQIVFVIVGSILIPRGKLLFAITVACVGIVLSLWTHVVGQYLVGSQVGLSNWIDVGIESVDDVIGTIIVLSWWAMSRSSRD